MAKYYVCKIAYDKQITDPESRDCGKIKSVNESYMVNALSCAEAEAVIIKEVAQYIKGAWTIKSIKAVNIADIFKEDDDLSENWYQAKVNISVVNEGTGVESFVAETILVRADEFAEAYKRFNDKMKNTMADYELVSLSKSQIVDLF